MPEFWTMLAAVATVVVPVAFLQAQNTKLLIENSISASEKRILGLVEKTYMRREVCRIAMQRPAVEEGEGE